MAASSSHYIHQLSSPCLTAHSALRECVCVCVCMCVYVCILSFSLLVLSVCLPAASHLTLNLPAHRQPGGQSRPDPPALSLSSLPDCLLCVIPSQPSVCLPAQGVRSRAACLCPSVLFACCRAGSCPILQNLPVASTLRFRIIFFLLSEAMLYCKKNKLGSKETVIFIIDLS